MVETTPFKRRSEIDYNATPKLTTSKMKERMPPLFPRDQRNQGIAFAGTIESSNAATPMMKASGPMKASHDMSVSAHKSEYSRYAKEDGS